VRVRSNSAPEENVVKVHRSSLSRVPLYAVLVLSALAAAPAAAQVSASGKNVATLDGEFDPEPGCTQDVPIGTITKGQKGAMLTVHITVSNIEDGTVPRVFGPDVNGIGLEGPASIDGQVTSQFDNSVVSGVWWIDLDEAEENEPGTIIGEPLVITIGQLCYALGGAPYHVTAVAQQTKN
jgi:hypothetical protein